MVRCACPGHPHHRFRSHRHLLPIRVAYPEGSKHTLAGRQQPDDRRGVSTDYYQAQTDYLTNITNAHYARYLCTFIHGLTSTTVFCKSLPIMHETHPDDST